MKNCSNCGAIISNSEARFCHVCGRPLEILQTDSNSFLSTLINPNIVRVVEILSEKYPNVLYPPPKEKAYKIRSNCKINPDIKLISLVDATVFGSCDEGVAFTNIGIFNKSMFLAPCFISWEEFSNCTLKLNKLSVDVISEYNKISLDISRASIKVPIFYNFLVELREEIKKLLNTTQIRENQTGSKIKNNSIDGVPSESCDCTNLNETVNKDIESENTLIDKSKQKKEEDTSSNVDQNINENRSSGLRNFYGKVSSFVTDNFSSSKKAKEDFPPKTSHNNSKENDSEFVEKHESDKKTIDDEAKQKQKEEEDTSSKVDQNENENRSSVFDNLYDKISSIFSDSSTSSKNAKDETKSKDSDNKSKENDSEFVEKHESDKKTIDDEAKQKQKEEDTSSKVDQNENENRSSVFDNLYDKISSIFSNSSTSSKNAKDESKSKDSDNKSKENDSEFVEKHESDKKTIDDEAKQKQKEEDNSSKVDQNENENRSSGLSNFYNKISSFVTDSFSSSKNISDKIETKDKEISNSKNKCGILIIGKQEDKNLDSFHNLLFSVAYSTRKKQRHTVNEYVEQVTNDAANIFQLTIPEQYDFEGLNDNISSFCIGSGVNIIYYCVNNNFSEDEKKIVNTLHTKLPSIPLCIVNIVEESSLLTDLFKKNNYIVESENYNAFVIKASNSEDEKEDKEFSFLYKWSLNVIPKESRLSFIKSYSNSLVLKKKNCSDIIMKIALSAAVVPIKSTVTASSDSSYLTNLQTEMISRICSAWNMNSMKDIAINMMQSSFTSNFGKGLVFKSTKFILETIGNIACNSDIGKLAVNTAVKMSIACSFTFAMGMVFNEMLYQFTKRTYCGEKVNVENLFDSGIFSKVFMSTIKSFVTDSNVKAFIEGKSKDFLENSKWSG